VNCEFTSLLVTQLVTLNKFLSPCLVHVPMVVPAVIGSCWMQERSSLGSRPLHPSGWSLDKWWD